MYSDIAIAQSRYCSVLVIGPTNLDVCWVVFDY